MERRAVFPGRLIPALLLAPQLAVTFIFFFWPAAQAILQSVRHEDAFGLSARFVWFDNFAAVFADPGYLASVEVTLVFGIAVASWRLR
jgi:sn-glycerol 3-phosphate transport system permease protein